MDLTVPCGCWMHVTPHGTRGTCCLIANYEYNQHLTTVQSRWMYGPCCGQYNCKMELSLIQYNLHLAIVRGCGINVTCRGISITCCGILKDLVIGQHICYVDRIN